MDLETLDAVALTVANAAEGAARSAVADSVSGLGLSSSAMPPVALVECSYEDTRHLHAIEATQLLRDM